ncbi:hypothetical protein AABB24_038476 [Solanum stoloniferum]|uniref:Uncharacterized protein n=1 Tax=Solanum stoloniferum TaxID=62892 RepID=A0ABD2R063_9SOLN
MASQCSSRLGNEVEETLDHISLMPKDVVASCVLSKRWIYLWNSIYNLLFSNRNYTEVENFISFVDRVLTCFKIKKFQLYLYYTSHWNCELKISRWISLAVEREVEDILLCSHDANLTYVLRIASDYLH